MGLPSIILISWLVVGFGLAPVRGLAMDMNIIIEGDRGGFGDIAQNLWMAWRLRLLYPPPQNSIKLIVPPNAAKKLHMLEPGFDPTSEIPTKVGGIWFFPFTGLMEAVGPPRADISLSFSVGSGRYARHMNRSPLMLAYSELYPFLVNGVSSRPEMHSHPRNVKLDLTAFKEVRSQAGLRNAGLLISPQRPPVPSRQALIEALRRQYPGEAVDDLAAGAVLGFSYTNDPRLTRVYIQAAARAAQAERFRGRKFVLAVPDVPDFGHLKLPENLKLLFTSGLALSESMIANSELPVMTTGDLSMNLALEHGKAAFYEVQDWKAEMARELADALVAASPELDRPDRHWRRLFAISDPDQIGLEDQMFQAFLDRDLIRDFGAAVEAIRPTHSIPAHVANRIDLFQNELDRRFLREFGRVGQESKTPFGADSYLDDAWPEIDAELDSGKGPAGIYESLKSRLAATPDGPTRIRLLRALLLFRKSSTDRETAREVLREIHTQPTAFDALGGLLLRRSEMDKEFRRTLVASASSEVDDGHRDSLRALLRFCYRLRLERNL